MAITRVFMDSNHFVDLRSIKGKGHRNLRIDLVPFSTQPLNNEQSYLGDDDAMVE